MATSITREVKLNHRAPVKNKKKPTALTGDKIACTLLRKFRAAQLKKSKSFSANQKFQHGEEPQKLIQVPALDARRWVKTTTMLFPLQVLATNLDFETHMALSNV